MNHFLYFLAERFRLSAAAKSRWKITSRAVLAIFGGYIVAALAAASLSLALPIPRPQAILGATMLAFPVHCVAVIWAFSAASAKRAWFFALGCAALPLLHLVLSEVLP